MKNNVICLLVSSIALPLFAQEDTSKIESQFSAELLLGSANMDASLNGLNYFSDKATSFGIRGAYSINDNFSIEGGFQNFGEIESSYIDDWGDTITEKDSASAFMVGVKGILPLEGGFALSARTGLSLWSTEAEIVDSSAPGERFKIDDSGTDVYFGVGAQYQITKELFVGLEYTLTTMNLSVIDIDMSNASLSLGYKF